MDEFHEMDVFNGFPMHENPQRYTKTYQNNIRGGVHRIVNVFWKFPIKCWLKIHLKVAEKASGWTNFMKWMSSMDSPCLQTPTNTPKPARVSLGLQRGKTVHVFWEVPVKIG